MTSQKQFLYKYFNLAGASATLRERRIRLSSPPLFNDPFDMQFRLKPSIDSQTQLHETAASFANALANGDPLPWPKSWSSEEKARATSTISTQYTPETVRKHIISTNSNFSASFEASQKVLDSVVKNFFLDHFVYSVASREDNLLLWSHYADKHRGLVIKFDCNPVGEGIFGAAEPVRYSNEYPSLGDQQDWIDRIHGKPKAIPPDLYKNIIRTKSLEWSYEEEWRLVVALPTYKGQNYAYIQLREPEVHSIYLGCMMPQEQVDAIIALTRHDYPNCKIFKTSKSDSDFKLLTMEIE